MATGEPKPAAPSMKAPKEKAISRACRRRSAEIEATDSRRMANWPLSTVMSYRKTAATTIQQMRSKPKAAP